MTATYIAIGVILFLVRLLFCWHTMVKVARTVGLLIMAVIGGCVVAVMMVVEEWPVIWQRASRMDKTERME